ncbi:MAG TPA: hypothetical protein VLB86_13800 [Gaiellaceae bacterium]|nr:hypothetical protein [Gaiellaceae bacterium]
MKGRLLGLVAVSAVAVVPAAHGSRQPVTMPATMPATTAPPPIVNVKVTITDSRINMHPKRGQRGAIGRFILLNVGAKPHTFTLGHKRHGTGTQTGFTKALRPGAQSIHVFYLDYRGKLPYLSPLPADRSKPGMRGTFTIY